MHTQIEPWMLWATLALGIPAMALLIWWLWVQFRPLPRHQEVRLCEHGKKPVNCGKCFEEEAEREIEAAKKPSDGSVYGTVADPTTPQPKFKPGQWMRIISNGYLVQLISDRRQGGWWDARASENGGGTVHVDAIEPAIPRKGEYWAWRDSVSTNMLPVGVDWASTPYNINRITNGEASPIYFGKGNQ